MENLFHSYWWLLFPLGWFIYAAWASWLNYRRQRETLDIVRRYADSGKEIPPQLMKVLEKPIDSEAEFWGAGSSETNQPTNYWSLFGLFGVLSAGFAAAAYFPNGLASDNADFAFMIVALVMAAVAVWAAICALTTKRGGKS